MWSNVTPLVLFFNQTFFTKHNLSEESYHFKFLLFCRLMFVLDLFNSYVNKIFLKDIKIIKLQVFVRNYL